MSECNNYKRPNYTCKREEAKHKCFFMLAFGSIYCLPYSSWGLLLLSFNGVWWHLLFTYTSWWHLLLVFVGMWWHLLYTYISWWRLYWHLLAFVVHLHFLVAFATGVCLLVRPVHLFIVLYCVTCIAIEPTENKAPHLLRR